MFILDPPEDPPDIQRNCHRGFWAFLPILDAIRLRWRYGRSIGLARWPPHICAGGIYDRSSDLFSVHPMSSKF